MGNQGFQSEARAPGLVSRRVGKGIKLTSPSLGITPSVTSHRHNSTRGEEGRKG